MSSRKRFRISEAQPGTFLHEAENHADPAEGKQVRRVRTARRSAQERPGTGTPDACLRHPAEGARCATCDSQVPGYSDRLFPCGHRRGPGQDSPTQRGRSSPVPPHPRRYLRFAGSGRTRRVRFSNARIGRVCAVRRCATGPAQRWVSRGRTSGRGALPVIRRYRSWGAAQSRRCMAPLVKPAAGPPFTPLPSSRRTPLDPPLTPPSLVWCPLSRPKHPDKKYLTPLIPPGGNQPERRPGPGAGATPSTRGRRLLNLLLAQSEKSQRPGDRVPRD